MKRGLLNDLVVVVLGEDLTVDVVSSLCVVALVDGFLVLWVVGDRIVPTISLRDEGNLVQIFWDWLSS